MLLDFLEFDVDQWVQLGTAVQLVMNIHKFTVSLSFLWFLQRTL